MLIVEDEGLAALALCEAIEFEGATVVGPAATVDKATAIALVGDIDAALLDVNLRGQLSFSVASILGRRGIPVVFVTGYTADSLPDEVTRHLVLTKPVGGTEVCRAIAGALGLPG